MHQCRPKKLSVIKHIMVFLQTKGMKEFLGFLLLIHSEFVFSFVPFAVPKLSNPNLNYLGKASDRHSFSSASFQRSFPSRVGGYLAPRRLTVDQSELNERIARFYDDRFQLLKFPSYIFMLHDFSITGSSTLWEEVWGEHMHMGHYGEDGNEKKTDLKAQIDMVDRLLDWGLGLDPPPAKVLDVGCGVGGSSRHIAKRYGSDVTGVTLSFLQCEHANLRSAKEGLSDNTHFIVADALSLPFDDNTFDLVWSLESGACPPIARRVTPPE